MLNNSQVLSQKW